MVKKNNKTKQIMFLSLVLIMSLFLVSACSEYDVEDTNLEVIKKVLELEFTGPNEKFMDLLWNPKYKTVVNGKEENKEVDKYVKEVYGPYFLDSYLNTFLNLSGATYQSLAYHSGYKLSFKEITIEQSEKMSNLYTFVATVGYQKNGGEEKTANVSGEATFSTKEEGKIGQFQYGDDDGLYETMREAVNQ
ncbi:hypothetical protein [Rummeliibacillus suwonensis]|uniref:hypothetical protein n=1 Tax=Rummeliibacillus suwonensis TaxID=1306154 RepID=UPI00289CF115|nr:hypothetical protein [Rummeliibacillus suwonensis]